MEWQPIEPGCEGRRCESVILAWRDEDGAHLSGEGYFDVITESWYRVGVGESAIYPTHWMPLPDPPSSAAQRAETR